MQRLLLLPFLLEKPIVSSSQKLSRKLGHTEEPADRKTTWLLNSLDLFFLPIVATRKKAASITQFTTPALARAK